MSSKLDPSKSGYPIGHRPSKQVRGIRLIRDVLAATRSDVKPGSAIGRAADIYTLLEPVVRGAQQEVFVVALLDTRHRIRSTRLVSLGTLDASLVHPRDVFRWAIRGSAAAIVVAHQHPSGDPEPSLEDVALTRRLAEAGRVVGIPLLDHVIIGDGRWVSLAERGTI